MDLGCPPQIISRKFCFSLIQKQNFSKILQNQGRQKIGYTIFYASIILLMTFPFRRAYTTEIIPKEVIAGITVAREASKKQQSSTTRVSFEGLSNRKHLISAGNLRPRHKQRLGWKEVSNRGFLKKSSSFHHNSIYHPIYNISEYIMTEEDCRMEAFCRGRQDTIRWPMDLWVYRSNDPNVFLASYRLSWFIRYNARTVYPFLTSLQTQTEPSRARVDLTLQENNIPSLSFLERQVVDTINSGVNAAVYSLHTEIISAREITQQIFTPPFYQDCREQIRARLFDQTMGYKLQIQEQIDTLEFIISTVRNLGL